MGRKFAQNITSEASRYVTLSDHGTERLSWCYWGNTHNKSVSIDSTKCDLVCLGNSQDLEVCGGAKKLSIYENLNFAQLQPVKVVDNFNLIGCFSDPNHGGVLQPNCEAAIRHSWLYKSNHQRIAPGRCVSFLWSNQLLRRGRVIVLIVSFRLGTGTAYH